MSLWLVKFTILATVSPQIVRCQRNFLSEKEHVFTKKSGVEIDIKCRSEQKITFWVKPSRFWQLITLVNPDDDGNEVINYSLIEPNTSYSEIDIGPGDYYTIWSTFLNDNGGTYLWRKGQTIQPWKEVKKKLQYKKYRITREFLPDTYSKGTYFIDGKFSWNPFDESDFCFQITNSCSKNTQGNTNPKKIWPDQNQTVIFGGLPLDDKCTLNLSGKFGTTVVTYETLSCYDLPGCDPMPENVRNLTVRVYQEDEDLWAVHVSWVLPKHAPEFYNVTLNITDNIQITTIPGNRSDIWFKNVEGEGRFYVSVWSYLANHNATASHKILMFPSREIFVGNDVLVGAYWVFGLLAGTAMFGSIVYWKRKLDNKGTHISFPEAQEKMSIEGDLDIETLDSISEDQWEIKPERLTFHEVIGEGAFGVVRKGTLAPSNKDVAIKMLKDFPAVDEIRSFRAEMELMKSVGGHPHVVSLVGCCSGRRPYIVAEYCSRGDLLTYLRCSWDVMISKRNAKYYNKEVDYRIDAKNRWKDSKLVVNRLYDLQGVCDTELTLLDLLSFCRQIAMGMEFLASNRIVHRDLAARNILVTRDRTLKIADFGLSRDIYQENQYTQKGNGKMPVKWMALESLTRRIYTTQSDVWSFGVVMWEVVTVGGAPYAGVSAARLPRLLAAGYRMPRPANCSPALYEVMSMCWHAAPVARPSFSELHARLDELLGARAAHYLALPTPLDALPPPHTHARAVRMLIRGNRIFGRNKSYERPQIISNHYTTQPPFNSSRETPDSIKVYK